jgi:hypothetical protein
LCSTSHTWLMQPIWKYHRSVRRWYVREFLRLLTINQLKP